MPPTIKHASDCTDPTAQRITNPRVPGAWIRACLSCGRYVAAAPRHHNRTAPRRKRSRV